MSDLRDLYQEVILDHNRQPRNFGALDDANRDAAGYNPLCGDRLRVAVRLDGDTIADVRFEGSGCAISKASASLMTERVKGRTVAEADACSRASTGWSPIRLGRHATRPARQARGVRRRREFPTRVKCATLAWHTLKAALHEPGAVASTE